MGVVGRDHILASTRGVNYTESTSTIVLNIGNVSEHIVGTLPGLGIVTQRNHNVSNVSCGTTASGNIVIIGTPNIGVRRATSLALNLVLSLRQRVARVGGSLGTNV